MARTFTVNEVSCILILHYELRSSITTNTKIHFVSHINYLNFRISVGFSLGSHCPN